MPFSLVLQKLSSIQASSEIFNIVLFMVSYILITGYSILLFMNPLNFKFLQVPAVLFYTFPTAYKSKRKERNITALVRLSMTVIVIDKWHSLSLTKVKTTHSFCLKLLKTKISHSCDSMSLSLSLVSSSVYREAFQVIQHATEKS